MASYSDILKKASKDWNCPDMMLRTKKEVPKIPFSSPLLNYATYGGIPRNAITEFHGLPGGGKSTSSIDICANAVKLFQEEYETEVARLREKIAKGYPEYSGQLEDLIDEGPKKVLYLDLEHSFDWKWANKMGINEGDIDVMQPPDIAAEVILQTFQELVCTGSIGLAVLDSIPSLVTQAELDKKYGERTVSSLAGLMTIFMRKIVPLLSRYNCTLVMINQVRDNMDNPYVVNTPGGNAIRFYSSLRMLFRLGAPLDFAGNELPQSTESPAGYKVNVKLVKQKSAPFDRKMASYFLMADSGIRPDFDYAQLAISKYGIIKKSGGWFTFCDPFTGEVLSYDAGKPAKVQGQVKVYDYLQSHQAYYNKLKNYIWNDINGIDNSELDEYTPDEIESEEVDSEGNVISSEGVEE